MKQRNKKHQPIERRKYPRIKRVLPLSLEGDRFFLVTETKNVSLSGAYCQVAQPIRESTKLGVTLLIPGEKGKKGDLHEIRCKGVVVRAEKIFRKGGGDVPETFFIAIYFTDVKKNDKDKLLRYIRH